MVAPEGTTAEIWLAEAEKTGWETPLKESAVTPSRLLPLRITTSPTLAALGAMEFTTGVSAETS